MFLLGVSVSPVVKAILGIAVVLAGILMHLVALDVIGAILVLMAVGQTAMHRRGAR